MKQAEKNLNRIMAILFLAVFLPVVFCVFFIGSKMQYTEYLKPSLLFAEPVVFLIALPVIALSVFVSRLGMKKPLRGKWDPIVSGILVFATIPLYFLSIYIAREIAFHIGWDVMVVDGAATQVSDRTPLGYQSYFSVYSNNIPIVYILGKILQLAKDHNYPGNAEKIWLQGNCIIMSLIGFLGIFFYQMLFEARARYLFVFLPVLIGVSFVGFFKIAALLSPKKAEENTADTQEDEQKENDKKANDIKANEEITGGSITNEEIRNRQETKK